MSNRRSLAFVGLTVFAVAVTMRTIPLYWSPLPFNTDGFKFAALARETLAYGYLPTSWGFFNPDEFTFTVLLTISSRLTGVSPLYIAQVLIASIGATVCLFVVAITRRIGIQLRWPDFDVRIAALLAGLVLATEGIFLGRSTAVSSEGLGHVFVLLTVFVFARALWTSRRSWLLLSVLVFALFPLTHNLGAIIGGFSAVSLLVLVFRESKWTAGLFAGALVAGFWLYTGLYYSIAELNEVSRISSVPGLFAAWIVVLILLTLWLPITRPRVQKTVPTMALVGGAGLLVVNYFVSIFPGTATTDPLTLLFVLPIAVIGIVAFQGIPSLIDAGREGYMMFALLIGSISIIGFALTGSLTIEYQDLAIRGQIFIHIVAAVLAGLGAVMIGRSWKPSTMTTAIVVVVIVCSLVSAPLAFSGLEATSAQPLVTQSEFETATFAVTYADGWTSDGHMTRLASKYYPKQTPNDVSQRGIYEWLHGGAVPSCPVVSQQSWTTVGAQLFPSSPKTIGYKSYEGSFQTRNLVYATSGNDPLIFTMPTNGDRQGCNW
ncbi:4-amino-4-deoxy-L-arabinose transferase [Haladaptatus litoreus]|uniref:4-amino-4-deoxy-L-arabinose transferase n=1 Tax=Haladaptatus litoreus TaxID=553468 RepID=A0A1N7DLA5_9EURY|nr:sodium/phosphate symporter [Haladaptatus litoreus]SIR76643.1 4-amino-4-deoxy-L-arabinose transferase [Haladaptatus litoreus]